MKSIEIEGKTVEEEEYEKLPLEVKSEFESKSQVVQEMIFDTLSELKLIENKADKKIDEWQSNVALLTVNIHINNVKSNYKRNKKINTFLDNVKKDILKNINTFMPRAHLRNIKSLAICQDYLNFHKMILEIYC